MSSRSRPASRAQLDRELSSARQQIEGLQAQLGQLSQQRDLLLHEVNHRVGNNLAVLLGLLDRERSAPEGELAAEASQRISRFILGLAVVQRLLSESGWRPLRLATLCRALLESVVSGVTPAARVRVADSDIEVTSRIADRIAVVLSELALNSLRHCADRDIIELEVRLSASQGKVVFEYRDSGPGYPEDVLREGRTLGGIGLITELAQQGLDGSLALANDSGAIATLTFAEERAPGGTAAGGAPLDVTACNGGSQ
jgi:two-component sensor histidine kinase